MLMMYLCGRKSIVTASSRSLRPRLFSSVHAASDQESSYNDVSPSHLLDSRSPFSLKDKVILVAGSGSKFENQWGIGSTTSILLANLGANVISVSRSIESSQAMEEQFRQDGVYMNMSSNDDDMHGKGCWTTTADCTEMNNVQNLVDRVMDRYGRIDVLINAGIHSAKTNGFKNMDGDAWNNCINLNLNPQYNLTKAVMPIFTEQKSGNIIFFSTIASQYALGMKRQRHGYAAGKAASTALTKRLGIEYARDGIRANVMNIGYTSGALVSKAVHHSNADEDEVRSKRDSCVPRGRQGTPDEVAQTAAFLASDASSFINATEIYCDGGSNSVVPGY